ncbi:hypothetical protein MtrunA17_Chr5g0414521 [Medicago truncatula]|uniref:Uncharacterized protein n=1 Tax=Medicago truncatula TaxID=3880 RepID=G7K487_MEDTR|nr:hypothetical protein MTR_5g035830 [Medicago truncatula]RHN55144.1 hypothetical protein MtrunA17_Chr5g0414521 [Medicago truncatula]
MTTVVSGDGNKSSREEDSSSDSVSTALVPVAPSHFTLKNIASQIDLLDILIVAGVGTVTLSKPGNCSTGFANPGYVT